MRKNISFALFLTLSLQSLNINPIPISINGPDDYTELLIDQIQTSVFQPIITSSKPTIIKVEITGYSSVPEQTDNTPFITASGKRVRDGVVATNFLPFGTKIKIPELFGDKIFIVEDRMARRYFHRIDIWFTDTKAARRFGVQQAEIIIL